jgi:exodeoxyribonuclease-3
VSRARAAEAPRITHPAFDHETRIAEVDLGDVVLASVYVPNGGKDFAAKMAFMDALCAYTTGVHERGRRLVLCGDVNIAREERDVHPKERKPNTIGQRPDERAAFERLLACGLVDVGRALDPDNDALFTWWAPWRNLRQRNIGWRLDYVLASDAVAASSCVSLASSAPAITLRW